eukprot:CAMPEP_0182460104 /NCGR_PEP_ID=MMETSP1319-20130603/5067_1 /TAXON_ID=172717 /ORGANISM="Bolidomonas pacifica, Strain RCC208" /LENGTH=246 /DNA_ID=CAMNT_0024659151 /DNA_START=138 /DNA_END=877 /DNA_ORIENTATION=-
MPLSWWPMMWQWAKVFPTHLPVLNLTTTSPGLGTEMDLSTPRRRSRGFRSQPRPRHMTTDDLEVVSVQVEGVAAVLFVDNPPLVHPPLPARPDANSRVKSLAVDAVKRRLHPARLNRLLWPDPVLEHEPFHILVVRLKEVRAGVVLRVPLVVPDLVPFPPLSDDDVEQRNVGKAPSLLVPLPLPAVHVRLLPDESRPEPAASADERAVALDDNVGPPPRREKHDLPSPRLAVHYAVPSDNVEASPA